MKSCARSILTFAGSWALLVPSTSLAADVAATRAHRTMTMGVFAAIIGLTLFVTYWAARRTRSAAAFYTAGGSISGLQNGLAITGDYLSAAAFLGVSGLVSLYGYDGILYLVGFFVAFVPVLLVVAEPCRNLGRYTLGDVLAFRNDFRSSKMVAALSSIAVAIFYLIPQIVGGGVLIKALVGIDYNVSVVFVGLLMLAYVLFGGMLATTWVQIIKAIMLLSACFVLVVLAWAPYGFSVPAFLSAVVSDINVQRRVGTLLGGATANGVEMGRRFLEPGLYLKNPLEQVSLGLALVLGTAAMPHILMRFFTVRDAKVARSSVVWSMVAIGGCHLLIIVIGFAAAHHVGAARILSFDKGGNFAAPLLAQYLGGGAESIAGNFLLAFVAAIAFATIVAVVAGLTLAAASAMAHDIYVGVIKRGNADARQQMLAAKTSTFIVGVVSIVIGVLAGGQNVAHLVGLAFAVAASANLPALVMTLYWRKCATAGVVLGVAGGTLTAIALVLVSPNVTYPQQVRTELQSLIASKQAAIEVVAAKRGSLTGPAEIARHDAWLAQLRGDAEKARQDLARLGDSKRSIVGLTKPLVPLRNPGIISIPIGFLLVIAASLLFPDRRAQQLWDEMTVRQATGLGIASSVEHETIMSH